MPEKFNVSPIAPSPHNGQIPVLVVSRKGVIRDALCSLMASATSVEVVGSADGQQAAIRLISEHRPHVVLSDESIRPPDIRQILGACHRARLLVLVGSEHDSVAQQYLASGASACLDLNSTGRQLIDSIGTVANADGQMKIIISRSMVSSLSMPMAEVPSDRQREVLLWVARGLSNRQIGKQLGLSEGTVKRHLANLYTTLGVNSRTEAIRHALSYELIQSQEITAA